VVAPVAQCIRRFRRRAREGFGDHRGLKQPGDEGIQHSGEPNASQQVACSSSLLRFGAPVTYSRLEHACLVYVAYFGLVGLFTTETKGMGLANPQIFRSAAGCSRCLPTRCPRASIAPSIRS